MTLDVEVRVPGVHLGEVLTEVCPGIMKVCDRAGITSVVSLGPLNWKELLGQLPILRKRDRTIQANALTFCRRVHLDSSAATRQINFQVAFRLGVTLEGRGRGATGSFAPAGDPKPLVARTGSG